MPELTRWRNILLIQTLPNSCIAAGFEFLLRYAGLGNSIIPDFQRYFEFYPPAGRSTLGSIRDVIIHHYDQNEINLPERFRNLVVRDYPNANEWETRVRQMNELIIRDNPFLAVIGSHIVPVIAISDLEITFLWRSEPNNLYQILVQRLEAYHADKYRIQNGGGTDIAWMP